jgi:hypothetical protein
VEEIVITRQLADPVTYLRDDYNMYGALLNDCRRNRKYSEKTLSQYHIVKPAMPAVGLKSVIRSERPASTV